MSWENHSMTLVSNRAAAGAPNHAPTKRLVAAAMNSATAEG